MVIFWCRANASIHAHGWLFFIHMHTRTHFHSHPFTDAWIHTHFTYAHTYAHTSSHTPNMHKHTPHTHIYTNARAHTYPSISTPMQCMNAYTNHKHSHKCTHTHSTMHHQTPFEVVVPIYLPTSRIRDFLYSTFSDPLKQQFKNLVNYLVVECNQIMCLICLTWLLRIKRSSCEIMSQRPQLICLKTTSRCEVGQ